MRLKPSFRKEYVLVYHYPPYVKEIEAILPEDTVVHKVRFANRQIEFTVKKTGEVYSTNYGYMFAENNKKNIKKLNEFRRARDKFFKKKMKLEKMASRVASIKGPFEGGCE